MAQNIGKIKWCKGLNVYWSNFGGMAHLKSASLPSLGNTGNKFSAEST
jgi:hypothetical protein